MSGQCVSNPFNVQRNEKQTMKQIAKLVLLGVGLFAQDAEDRMTIARNARREKIDR